MKTEGRLLAFAAGSLLLALGVGCVPTLEQHPVKDIGKVMPARFTAATSSASSSSAELVWQEFMRDEQLAGLIDDALANNLELEILAQRIEAANAEIGARRGESIPRLDFRAGGGVEKVAKHTSQGQADEVAGVPDPLGDLHLGFVASWEVDVWMKLRNATRAAVLRALATVEGRRFAVTKLVAEVASSYYGLMALDNELAVLDHNIRLQKEALETTKLLKASARVTELAVQRFQAEVLKNESRRYQIAQEIVELENRLNVLVGRFPQRVERTSSAFDGLTPRTIVPGVPTQLLENRPDVRQAELTLKAAELDVEVARAMFYPSLGIEMEIGYKAFSPDKLFTTPESLLFGAAANLVAPLFNRSKITAEYLSAHAEQLQAVFEYQRTVLEAYAEVATEISKLQNLGHRHTLKAHQVERLEASTEVSGQLFLSARADYLEVLSARREVLEAQLELVEIKRMQMEATVNAYRALGGGWKTADEVLARKAEAQGERG